MIEPGPKKPKLAAQLARDVVSVSAPGTADASSPPHLPVNTLLCEGG